jgi:hypothetical protein
VWRDEWQLLGRRELPAVLDGTASVMNGPAALGHLADEMARLDTKVSPVPAGRARQLPQTVRPSLGWASQTGGSWNRAEWPAALR